MTDKKRTRLQALHEAVPSTSTKVANRPTKKPKKSTNFQGSKQPDLTEWPNHFKLLFKVFKALNTVLAFVSSRRELATSFPVIRQSVENITKQPLELAQVAELKALLPEIITFSYVPTLPEDTTILPGPSSQGAAESEGHVLRLEFVDNWNGGSKNNQGLFIPSARSATLTKKLIDKRNNRFIQAVEDLLQAVSAEEDAVVLLQTAAKACIPVMPEQTAGDDDLEPYFPVPEPKDRPSVQEVLTGIMSQHWYKDQIVTQRTFQAKDGHTDLELDEPLSSTIQLALKDSRNITSLYSHQVTAINAIGHGKNVIVSTSTASGKSVIYQVPLLRFLEEDPEATAIFVYPTKALAQDQRGALEQLLCACPGLQHVKVSTYDGDTPQDKRKSIRETASVILTNFDMIHVSILPQEDCWRRFFKNIKLFVVDELHYYMGLFGTHVAYIMRRFRRICAAVGNRRIRFVSCSATISNPGSHMERIFGLDKSDVEVITEDGAPTGEKSFVVWQPSTIDPVAPGFGRDSSLSEAVRLMIHLMKHGIRVILFCKFRRACEMVMKALRVMLGMSRRSDILHRVKSYRGGYSPEDRRDIERDAFSGQLLGIVATNALELGVDIGALDAVIMLGFPLNISSLRQQTGRAGRRSRDSLAILVAEGLPIDQYYVNHPEDLFDKSPDDLVIDLDSKLTLEAHLQCAANEMPVSLKDQVYFGPLMVEVCKTRLIADDEGWYHTHHKFRPYPSKHIALRGVQEDKYLIIDVTQERHIILEEMEMSRVLFEIYDGGVVCSIFYFCNHYLTLSSKFIHQGTTYIVKELRHSAKTATLIQKDVDYITSPRDYTDVNAAQTLRIREIKGSSELAYYGNVEVRTLVFGYFVLKFSPAHLCCSYEGLKYFHRDRKIKDVVDLDNDPWEQETVGMWLDVPKQIPGWLNNKGIKPAAAIHAAEHAFLNKFALAQDVRTECKAEEKEIKIQKESQRKRPARLIFCDHVGQGMGSGVTAKAFDNVYDILHKAYEAVVNCDCEDLKGCNKCVQSPSCTEGNKVCSKSGALVILKALLGYEVDPASIPDEHDTFEGGTDTIVSASHVRKLGDIEIERDLK
ncbi:P-loop containing nucleoside triphosphate hydrolase protein [Desarmillaria tabescens]|uniref:P-loop containing nucleoside triphosphate hydrolase protein n=1 Tax=Armillaria tabescens TaxID=1929756 RepID=A0AA39JXA7_ARMTA|nr:P-loop containing nucleoside triphosphate hydrolase protein [Desarmillaria tabescens]KAK0448318.1 P-loop containing nucleoside triphosphate hydrolase protein [Desarmillaria tabescens]